MAERVAESAGGSDSGTWQVWPQVLTFLQGNTKGSWHFGVSSAGLGTLHSWLSDSSRNHHLGSGTLYAPIVQLVATKGQVELWTRGWDPVSGIREVFLGRWEEAGV